MDDIREDTDRHYIHVSFELIDPIFEPRLMEPEYCTEWRYFPLDGLPDDFMDARRGIMANYLAKRLYKYEL